MMSHDLILPVTAVINAIWYDIDFEQGANVSGFFTAEGSLRFDQREFHGREQIDRVYADRAARGDRVSRHGATNIHVVQASASRATVVSLLTLFASDGVAPIGFTEPAAVSDVLDSFVLQDGAWLIESRAILTRFKDAQTVLAVPTT